MNTGLSAKCSLGMHISCHWQWQPTGQAIHHTWQQRREWLVFRSAAVVAAECWNEVISWRILKTDGSPLTLQDLIPVSCSRVFWLNWTSTLVNWYWDCCAVQVSTRPVFRSAKSTTQQLNKRQPSCHSHVLCVVFNTRHFSICALRKKNYFFHQNTFRPPDVYIEVL